MGVILDLVREGRNKYYFTKECKEILDILDKISDKDDNIDCIEDMNEVTINKIIGLNGLVIRSVKFDDGYVFPDGTVMSGDFYEHHSVMFSLEDTVAIDVSKDIHIINQLDRLEEQGADIEKYIKDNNIGREVYNLEVSIPKYTKDGKYVYNEECSYEISKDLYTLLLEKGLKELCEV